MGKNDPGGLKALANRQKQKGLQKLRWYCQMCSKQCRDENGFKCHLSSESHARQMALFGEAPAAVVDEFSRQFEDAWLDHMRRAHPTTRVRADLVYNELIQHRDHVHMNATRWHTLTEFVSYLGKKGLCRVDEDERGLHVTLAAADSRVAGDEEARARRARLAAEADARRATALAAQAERARREEELALGPSAAAGARGGGGELVRKEGDAPVRLSVAVAGGGGGGGGGKNGAVVVVAPPPIFASSAAAEAAAATATTATTTTATNAAAAPQRPKSKLELLMEQEQAAKRKREEEEEEKEKAAAAIAAAAAAAAGGGSDKRLKSSAGGGDADNKKQQGQGDGGGGGEDDDDDAPWLSRGLVVKIVAKELKSSGHYKRKAAVVSVVGGGFVGELETLAEGGEENGKGGGRGEGRGGSGLGFGGGDILRVDQAQLETVLPGVGGAVRVVSCSATNRVNRKRRRKREKGGRRGGDGAVDGDDGGDGDDDGDVSRFVGREGTLAEVDAANYRARVVFSSSSSSSSGDKKKESASFEYEDVCKVIPL